MSQVLTSRSCVPLPFAGKIFSNATLLQQIATIPQVVNNGADGKGAVVGATASVDISPPVEAPAGAKAKDKVAPRTVTGAVMPAGSQPDLTDHETLMSMSLTVVVFGATGDLAKKKWVPRTSMQLCGIPPPDS